MLSCEQILSLLRADVVPALGCTEPVCVALCSAAAAGVLGEPVKSIRAEVSPGIFKNGMSAGIPHCAGVGLHHAAALGAVLKNAEKGLELLGDITEETLAGAAQLLESGAVSVAIEKDKRGVYARCRLQGEDSESVCVIEGGHSNVVYLEKDGAVLKQCSEAAGAAGSEPLVEELAKMSIAQIRRAVDAIPAEELRFLADGVCMNESLAAYSEEKPMGVGLAAALRQEREGGLLSDDLLGRLLVQVVSAAENRLDGCPLPTMSSSGAGTKGLVVILPVWEMAKALRAGEAETLRALALAHLVNRTINVYIGKLSPMCSCVMSSSTAASVGMCYLLGGSDEAIGHAVRNMAGTVTGMICDGDKVGCALKVAAGTQAALLSALLAARGAALRVSDGICAESPEQCIRNMARVGIEGMKETDGTILQIMQKK